MLFLHLFQSFLLLLHYCQSSAFLLANQAKCLFVSSIQEETITRVRPLTMNKKKRKTPRAKTQKKEDDSEGYSDDDVFQRKPPIGTKRIQKIKKNEEQTAPAVEVESVIPPEIKEGSELPMKLFYVSDNYALGSPVGFAEHLKGKLSRTEVSDDDFNVCDNMTMYYNKGDVVHVSVKSLTPPDRLEVSVRRVRNVLSEKFNPHTLAVFKLPNEDMDIQDVEEQFEKFGKVLEVVFPSTYWEVEEGLDRGPTFVTMERKEDAMRAMRELKSFEMTYDDGENVEYEISIRSSYRQDFKERLQKQIDRDLEEKIAIWDETPFERKMRLRAEEELWELVPYYMMDLENQRRNHFPYFRVFNTRIIQKAQVPEKRMSREFNATETASKQDEQ